MSEPLEKGERYRCPIDDCGCVVEVVEGAKKCAAETPQPVKMIPKIFYQGKILAEEGRL